MEGRVFFGFKIDKRDERAFNFAREEDRDAATSEVDGRQSFSSHESG